MRLIPKALSEQISFFAQRLDTWAQDPAALGLSEEDVSNLSLLVEQAATARAEAGQARNAAEAATLGYHDRAAELRAFGAGCIQQIKAFAARQEEPNTVYVAAVIDPPRRPGPPQPPPTPRDVRAKIDTHGVLTMTWKCSAPPSSPESRGGHVLYTIERSVNDGPMELIGLAGEKKFIDDKLPAGEIFYAIRARRGTLISAGAAQLTVIVGRGSAQGPAVHIPRAQAA